VALAWLGEDWWVTALALYAPRIAFAAPLPVLLLLMLVLRIWRSLWTLGAAALIVLFPLMGFVLPSIAGVKEGAPLLKVLSFNVNAGYGGTQRVIDEIAKFSPDVVLLQEVLFPEPFVETMKARYPHVESSTQFVVASRFPILSTFDPGRLAYGDGERSARFLQHRIDTPLGPIAFYNVHPISPRGVLRLNRLRGGLRMLRSGELLAGDPEGDVNYNAGLRSLQAEAIATRAARERDAVVIAGDTNLPGLSRALRRFSAYDDGFAEIGWGFGYTYPARHAWLRLDRIFASPALRFASFEVGCEGASDHLCVVAQLQKR
jgi:endonuclease/exonuclease/phosphatase (EEP) superfamily protein YafD